MIEKNNGMRKKAALMEKCYNGFAEPGLHGTGIRTLAKYCGYNATMIYTYFKDLDDLIIQSTEYCMSRVEAECMAKAPTILLNLKLYKEALSANRRARRLGVPSAKRQTVQTNEFVRIW